MKDKLISNCSNICQKQHVQKDSFRSSLSFSVSDSLNFIFKSLFKMPSLISIAVCFIRQILRTV